MAETAKSTEFAGRTVALVLCVGAATRMRPLSLTTPKALLPFCGRPLIEYTLAQLAWHQILAVRLIVGMCDFGFKNYEREYGKGGTEISVERRGLEFGSAGVVRAVANALADRYDQFLVIYGDSLFRIDLTEMLRFHSERRAEGCEMTLAYHTPEDLIVPGQDRSNYGIISLGAKNKITGFTEKPDSSRLPSSFANAGVFVLSRAAIRRFPTRLPLDFSSDIFSVLASGEESRIFGFDIASGYRYDVGTIRDYVKRQFAVLDGRIFLEGITWQQFEDTRRNVINCVVSDETLLGKDCKLGRNVAFRGRNVVGDRVSIGDDSELSECVILDDTSIGPGVKIEGVVLGRFCQVEEKVALGKGTVLGDFSVVTT